MDNLAIIVCFSHKSSFQQSNRERKMNFQQICYKNCRVAFRLVLNLLQTTWAAEKKEQKLILTGSWFLRNGIFILGMYFGVDYIYLAKSVFTAYNEWLVFIGW